VTKDRLAQDQENMIDKEQLITVVKKVNALFDRLMEKYPGLKGHLVFSSIHGQCDVTGDISEILKYFPEMICDSDDEINAIRLIGIIDQLKAAKKESSLSKQEEEAINKLIFKDDIFVEIRFSKPDSNLIFEMQKDPLVSQKHTPQGCASIRIVLGTLDEIDRNDDL
jgi:hypothetical protein